MKNNPSISYFNRDLSWLKFNERVLYQATDTRMPLLERVRFISIFSTNLDEFFMKRVGFLKRAQGRALLQVGSDQANPSQLLNEIREVVLGHISSRQKVYEKELLPELKKNGIQFLKWEMMSKDEKNAAGKYFREKVFPVLTPLAVDKAHPFPFLSNLSVSLGVNLKHPKNQESMFARIKIPDVLPQWVQLSEGQENGYRLIRLQDLISSHLNELFPEMIVESSVPFRVTRNADIEYMSDDVEDHMDIVEEELRLRRLAKIVRLEHSDSANLSILPFLKDELELSDPDLYLVPGELSYQSLSEIANLNIPSLRFKPHHPSKPMPLKDETRDIFSIIKERDILVHHPYESFTDSVERLIREAVRDPKVLAIKMTLYRAGENNPIIPLLVRAAEKGKQVVAVIELKARFDEARNIYWSEMLEKAGVHVVYGVVGKKIHTKSLLIIRQEGDSYCFYSHIGTGNYNPATAKLYTDYSLLTADKRLGNELIEVFNFLTGLSLKKNYQKLLVSPVNMRKRFLQYIKKEIEHAKSSRSGGRIIAKMNSLEDQEICDALYEASKNGVKIDLIVRGFCCLKPQVKGLSENIRVISIIGRFLEHSRVFYFQRGAKEPLDGKFYIGSADWMYRNLNNRIETIAPVEETENKQMIWKLFELSLGDRLQAWELDGSGEYKLLRNGDDSGALSSQEELMKLLS